MAKKRTVVGDQWHARGSDGKTYTVVEWHEEFEVSTIHDDGEVWERSGLRAYRLADGSPVNARDGGFVIVATGVLLARA